MIKTIICLVSCICCLSAKFVICSYSGYHKLTRSITISELENPLFCSPAGVVVINFSENDRATFVVDEGWHRILYTREGADWIKAVGVYGSDTTDLKRPLGCTADEYNNIYVADCGNHRIVKCHFDTTENELFYCDTFLLNNEGVPWDVSYWSGVLYASDIANHCIVKFDTAGTLLDSYGEYGTNNGQFNTPQGVAVIRDTVYIADMGNQRMIALRDYNGSFNFLKAYYVTELERPFLQDVEVDSSGGIYVIDQLAHEIFKFAPGLSMILDRYDGGYVGQYIWPRFMDICGSDAVVVEEWGNNSGIRYYSLRTGVVQVSLTSDTLDLTERNMAIWFMLDGTAEVSAAIYNGSTLVKELFSDSAMGFGGHQISWDGHDLNDALVIPGSYLVVLHCESPGGMDVINKAFTVKGTIKFDVLDVNEHWTETGEPYVLTADVYLDLNGRLEIDPGVKVMPTGNYGILPPAHWNGSIFADGNAINKILFTPHRKLCPEPDSIPFLWKGIDYRIGAAWQDTLLLDHCIVEAAGSESAAVWCKAVQYVSITNTEICKSGMFGVYCDNYCDTVIVNNSTFENNDSIPLHIPFKSINRIKDNDFTGNKPNVIGVKNTSLGKDATIWNQGVPYWFLRNSGWGWFAVYGDECPTLTINPGVEILFADTCGLYAGDKDQYGSTPGKIVALGKADSIIKLSALDTLKHWGGVHIYHNSPEDTSKFEWCEISYGGQYIPNTDDCSKGNISFLTNKIAYVLKNCQISHSLNYGSGNCCGYETDTMISVVKNNTFTANDDSFPLVISSAEFNQCDSNEFIDNGINKILVKNGGNITKNMVMRNQGVPYAVGCELILDDSLLVERENIIEINNEKLTVNSGGMLRATGVTFTAYDTVWWGMKFSNCQTDTSVLDSCIIEKARYHTGIWPAGAIALHGSLMRLSNSYLLNNEKGVYVTGASTINLINNMIAQNSCGLHTFDCTYKDTLHIYIRNNDFVGNRIAMQTNCWPTGGLDATNNWWGDATGPWDPTDSTSGPPDCNRYGRGDSIGDHVIYRPWLTAPNQGTKVTLLNPNGDDTLYCENNYDIKWSKTVTPMHQELYYTTDFPTGGFSEGEFWTFIDTVAATESSYVWNVASTPASRCRVAIKLYYEPAKRKGKSAGKNNVALLNSVQKSRSDSRDYGQMAIDISDTNFTIADTVSPQITMVKPNGSEYFIPAKEETLRWQASDNHKLDHFDIFLSEDGGYVYSDTIIEDLGAPCSTYAWTIPEKNNYRCKIMVVANDSSANGKSDACDSIFYIPVKSSSEEMSAFNNATRLVRSFGANLHLVYTTTESKKIEKNRKRTYSADVDMVTVSGTSYDNHYGKQMRGDKIYYTKSTDFGVTWQSPTEIGVGEYPALSMNSNATKVGATWQNSGQNEIYYRYWTPMGGWARIDTLFKVTGGITYSPPAIGFVNDTMHLTTIRTVEISGSEIVQYVLYTKFYWNNASPTMSLDTVNHWRITYSGDYPQFSSIAMDGNNRAHVAWERPPGDTLFSTFKPFDIYYSQQNGIGIGSITNVSNSDSNSINPSIECYGGHYYIVWQEKVDGYSIFLYKRNYAGFPPSSKTDTLSTSLGDPKYPVTSMGGVVLWAAGDTADIYGRIWDSEGEKWLDMTNWSNTGKSSEYPVVDAWQNEGGTDIMAGWTEDTGICGFGEKYVSLFPSKGNVYVAFPSYCLVLGDSLSTPFTKYRSGTAEYHRRHYDYGHDSLVYCLPHIDRNAKCQIYVELYRPDSKQGKSKNQTDDKWKIRLSADDNMHHTLQLSPGEFKTVKFNVPAAVNSDGHATIRLSKIEGELVLVRRILFYEFERNSDMMGELLAEGPQGGEAPFVNPVVVERLYPNPAKNMLNVRIHSPCEQQVRINLYDVTGRQACESINNKVGAGANEISVMTDQLAAGVYFLRLETDAKAEIEKVIIVR